MRAINVMELYLRLRVICHVSFDLITALRLLTAQAAQPLS